MTAGALSQEVSLRLDLKYKHILAYQITWKLLVLLEILIFDFVFECFYKKVSKY